MSTAIIKHPHSLDVIKAAWQDIGGDLIITDSDVWINPGDGSAAITDALHLLTSAFLA